MNTKHNNEENIINEKNSMCADKYFIFIYIYICIYLFRLIELDVDNKTPPVL